MSERTIEQVEQEIDDRETELDIMLNDPFWRPEEISDLKEHIVSLIKKLKAELQNVEDELEEYERIGETNIPYQAGERPDVEQAMETLRKRRDALKGVNQSG